MRALIHGVLCSLLFLVGASGAHGQTPPDALGFAMTTIDGKTRDLSDYRGKVVLMVNVASRCGLTPQYEQLETLYEQYKDDGLVVLGFPANNFAGQEPGSDADIREFCTQNYNVTFPMFSKISVTGDDTHPLFKQLAALPEPLGGEPKWNFTKFLIDRSGHVVARFEPRVKPDAPQVIAAVEGLVDMKAGERAGSAPSPTRGLWF